MSHDPAPRGRVHPLAPRYAGDPLLELTGLEQAARIADGALTSSELVDRYLARIARYDPALSAFVTVLEGAARREAERADRARREGRALGAFHGVPTAIKDHHLVRFTRTRVGSRAFDWLWSPVDNGFVRAMRRAGFVIVGKTTMSELGILPIVETEIQQPTRNPWNTARTAGGSSGGAGAAIASGMLPLAPGSDGAGSVRIPAALNGLVGLKPSRGLVPDGSDKIDAYGLATNGPMARGLDDAAALLDAMAAPGRQRHRERAREPARPLRVGMILEAPVGEVDPRIAARVEAAAERLRDAGHTVERRPPPKASLDDFVPVYQRFTARLPMPAPGRLSDFARWFWSSGKGVAEADAARLMRGFVDAGREVMKGLDLVLSPTVGVLPFEVGEFAHLDAEGLFRAVAPLGAFTALANVTGQPALSVPFGEVEGMPVGVQLMGAHGDDARLFSVARALE